MGTFLRFRGGRYLIVSIHFQDAKQQVTYGNGIFIPVTKVQNEKNKTKQKKNKKTFVSHWYWQHDQGESVELVWQTRYEWADAASNRRNTGSKDILFILDYNHWHRKRHKQYIVRLDGEPTLHTASATSHLPVRLGSRPWRVGTSTLHPAQAPSTFKGRINGFKCPFKAPVSALCSKCCNITLESREHSLWHLLFQGGKKCLRASVITLVGYIYCKIKQPTL